MKNKLHTIYMAVSPIVIAVLLVLTVLYWKQKRDCEKKTKEGMCLCGGPQIAGRCKPYDYNTRMGWNVDTPRKSQVPPPLNMPYDVLQFGYQNTRPSCGF